MERQEGYYWVKYQGDYVISRWNGRWWHHFNDEEWTYDDNEYEFINENRIKAPGELPD